MEKSVSKTTISLVSSIYSHFPFGWNRVYLIARPTQRASAFSPKLQESRSWLFARMPIGLAKNLTGGFMTQNSHEENIESPDGLVV